MRVVTGKINICAVVETNGRVAAPAHPVDAEVDDEAVQPGGQPGLAAIRPDGPDEADEGVLGEVGGVGGVSGDAHRDAVHVTLLLGDEGSDSRLVTRLGASDDLRYGLRHDRAGVRS